MYGFDLLAASHRAHYPLPRSSVEQATSWDFPSGSRHCPLIIAHRGDVTNAPENTLAAFQQALERGADGIELDVRLTRDGQLVVFHDRNLKRIGGMRRLVTNATLDEVRAWTWGAGLRRSSGAPRLRPWMKCSNCSRPTT